jgi:hypothetical protein
MNRQFVIKGMIYGMRDMGAKFIKSDRDSVYFDVTKGSEIDDNSRLQIAKEMWERYGYKLKIRKI